MVEQQLAIVQQQAGRDPNEIVDYGKREPYIDGATVASIQTVFARSRLSHRGWQPRQLEGRLDSRAVWRSDARGHVDIFRERHAPSVTKVDVWLLVDASGSMRGSNACRAQDVVGTLVEAFKRQPSVTLHVYQHNASAEVSLYRVWEPGRAPKVNQMLENVSGGNADGFALQAIGERALRARRPDTKTVIVMVSDGLPSVHGRGATNYEITKHSALVAQTLRDKGVQVMAVAIAGANDQHIKMYGAENVVPFNQRSERRWSDLARSFSAIFAKTIREGANR